MSVMNMWSVCDRCGFDYKRRDLRKETTKFVVCSSCYDGRYDKKSHPQNRPFRPRRELLPVPDGRPQQIVPNNYMALEAGNLLLQENDSPIIPPPSS